MSELREDQPAEAMSEDELVETKSNKRGIAIVVVAMLVIIAGLVYWHSTYSESTGTTRRWMA